MAGNSAAQATELTAVYSRNLSTGHDTITFTTPLETFAFDGSGNEQWIKFRVFSGATLNFNATVANTANCTAAYDINTYSSTSDTEDGSTLTIGYSNYFGTASQLANLFGGQGQGNAQWVFIRLIQYTDSNNQPHAEQFEFSCTATIFDVTCSFGGYSNDDSTHTAFGNANGYAVMSTSTAGLTSLEPIHSTSSVRISGIPASDDISNSPDISHNGTVLNQVDGASWNIGTQQPGEIGITAYGITWTDTTWHRFNMAQPGAVRFYDDPVEANAAVGYGGLSGTLIAVYSGPANATYAELTLLGSNLTINQAGTNYTGADLSLDIASATWLYIEHAFIGDLNNDHSATYPDQAMSWQAAYVTAPTPPATVADDGLLMIGATLLGGDVGDVPGGVATQTDDGLFSIGITMLGGDTGTTGSATGGGGGTTVRPALKASVLFSTQITATLTKRVPQALTLSCTGDVLSDPSLKLLTYDTTPINAQPTTLFV